MARDKLYFRAILLPFYNVDGIALSDRKYCENGQKIHTDNFGLTRQDTENSVQRDYVVDYTSAIKNDLMVYENGGFKTSYTYGANGRISQMTRHLEDEINPVTGKTISTTANAKGENINTNIAVEKLGKLYYHLDRLGSTAFITDETGMVSFLIAMAFTNLLQEILKLLKQRSAD